MSSRSATCSGTRAAGRSRTTGSRRSGDAFEDREHGGWFPEVTPDGPARSDKEAYPHAFVLLAAASAAMAGRAAAPRAARRGHRRHRARASGPSAEGACRRVAGTARWDEPEPYRGANANMHMVEAFLAAGDATGDARWYERALRIAERLIGDVARAHDWRILEHFDARLEPAARVQRRPAAASVPAVRDHARARARVVAPAAPAPRRASAAGPTGSSEAARGLFARAVADGWAERGGFVYTTGPRRSARRRATGSLARSRRRSAPPPRCTRSPATATTSAGTAAAGTSPVRTCIDRERGSWHAELDEALAAERADLERQAGRLPLAPGHAHPAAACRPRASPARCATGGSPEPPG